jgi:hypothetical protein
VEKGTCVFSYLNDVPIHCFTKFIDDCIVFGNKEGSLKVLNLSSINTNSVVCTDACAHVRACLCQGVDTIYEDNEKDDDETKSKKNARDNLLCSITTSHSGGNLIGASSTGIINIYVMKIKDDQLMFDRRTILIDSKEFYNRGGHYVTQLPDERIFFASTYGFIRLWDIKHDGTFDETIINPVEDKNRNTYPYGRQHSYANHNSLHKITCSELLTDGRVVSGSMNGTLKIWC